MPWTGSDVATQREQFVVRATSGDEPFKQLCGCFGISRTTGYHWVRRYEELGTLRDLGERSRRPHQIPNRTAPDIELKVLDLRDREGWGARRLAVLLRQQNVRLATSTIHNILRRYKRIGIDSSDWAAAWMIQVLLADDPLRQLQREFPNAIDISKIAHLLGAGKLRERKKAMAVVACLKRIPVTVISKCLQLHSRAVTRYFNRYISGGTTELFRRRRVRNRDDEQDKYFLFSVLHSPPSAHGINRTSWKMDDLHRILSEAGHRMSYKRIRGAIKAAGFRWRKARVVLTSTDPEYAVKLDRVKKILSQLGEDEAFFSIDEYGPFAIKMKGGRKRIAPGEKYVVPQWQKSKGWTIITAALELSGNQVTHFYSWKKNTDEMIKMTNLLREQYRSRRTLYLSWDAASWHISKKLVSHLALINEHASTDGRPMVNTAPLPAGSQFLNVIESVFSGMARAIIHNSDYPSLAEAKQAIDRYFKERNEHFTNFRSGQGARSGAWNGCPANFRKATTVRTLSIKLRSIQALPAVVEIRLTGETSPLHSKPPKKAHNRRKLALTPVFVNHPLQCGDGDKERQVVTALASPFIALLSAWLWTWFVAPAILRAFGVPMVSGQWRWNRRDQHLSKRQYVWGYGVFAWGTGMFLFFVLTDYLSWRTLGDRFSHPTPTRVALELVIFLGAGWTVGAYGAPKHTT